MKLIPESIYFLLKTYFIVNAFLKKISKRHRPIYFDFIYFILILQLKIKSNISSKMTNFSQKRSLIDKVMVFNQFEQF